MGRGTSKAGKGQSIPLNKMNRQQLEAEARRLYIANGGGAGLSAEEAARRFDALVDGNTDAQLRRYIQKHGGTSSASVEKEISKAVAPIDPKKTGASYNKLPKNFQQNIDDNLKPSQEIQNMWRSGNKNKAQDEWTTGVAGKKPRRKVITDYSNGKVNYTVKDRNKVVLKTTDKNRVANKIAEFILDLLRG